MLQSIVINSNNDKFMGQLRAFKHFAATVEAGNFNNASKCFYLPEMSISNRIAGLEVSLSHLLLTKFAIES